MYNTVSNLHIPRDFSYVYGKYLVGIVGMKFYAAAHEAVAGSVSAVLARRPLAAPAW